MADLLRKMQGASTAPKPVVLGMVGKDHLTAWMAKHGVSPSSIKYVCKKGIDGFHTSLKQPSGSVRRTRHAR